MGVFLTSCRMGQLGNYRFNYNPNLAVAPAKADGAGEGDRVYAIFMLFGPFLPLFSIKNI